MFACVKPAGIVNSAFTFPPVVHAADDASGENWNAPVVAEPALANVAVRAAIGAVAASSAQPASVITDERRQRERGGLHFRGDREHREHEVSGRGGRSETGIGIAVPARVSGEHPLVRPRFWQRCVATVSRTGFERDRA